MSLTGNLEIFPMPEVLRLLSRSKKTGCLRVDAVETEGRVYLAGGAITFANTQSDDVVRQAMINAGLVTDDSLRAAKGSLPDALVEGADPGAVTDFVRELVVESLYRIRKPGHGDFEFAVDAVSTYESGQQFDAEVAVAESDRRAAEWSDILETISNLDAPIRMVRELPDDNSVTIAAPTWKVLASLEGGTSVRELAYRTGMSEFRAARELSGLIRSELVAVVDLGSSHDSGYQAPVIERRAPEPVFVEPEEPAQPAADIQPSDEFDSFFDTTPVEQEQPAQNGDEPSSEDDGWEQPSPWDAPVEADVTGEVEEHAEERHDDAQGWFDEAVGEIESPVDEPDSQDESTVDDDVNSDGGWWATAMDTPEKAEDDPTSDPDSFLESVFSQLSDDGEENPEEAGDEDETGFSMGLLRRRRMGAAARDITEG